MRGDRALWIFVAASSAIAFVGCLPFLDLVSEDNPLLIVPGLVAFPGLMASAMVTNLHDPNPYLATVFACAFWVVVFVLCRKLWRKFRHG